MTEKRIHGATYSLRLYPEVVLPRVSNLVNSRAARPTGAGGLACTNFVSCTAIYAGRWMGELCSLKARFGRTSEVLFHTCLTSLHNNSRLLLQKVALPSQNTPGGSVAILRGRGAAPDLVSQRENQRHPRPLLTQSSETLPRKVAHPTRSNLASWGGAK